MRRPDHLIYDRYVADQVRAYADKKGKRTSHKAGSVHVISHILRLFAFIKLPATISKYVEVARRLFSSFDLVYYKLRCCSICVHHGLNAGASQYFFSTGIAPRTLVGVHTLRETLWCILFDRPRVKQISTGSKRNYTTLHNKSESSQSRRRKNSRTLRPTGLADDSART